MSQQQEHNFKIENSKEASGTCIDEDSQAKFSMHSQVLKVSQSNPVAASTCCVVGQALPSSQAQRVRQKLPTLDTNTKLNMLEVHI